MRWPKHQKRWSRVTDWHKWFAWYPVTIGDTRVWLEVVSRKLSYDGYTLFWEYRDA